MLLAVDTGNTQTHIGIFRKDALVAQWRTSTEPDRTADELALIFQQFLALVGLSFSREVTGSCSAASSRRRRRPSGKWLPGTSISIRWWWRRASGPGCR